MTILISADRNKDFAGRLFGLRSVLTSVMLMRRLRLSKLWKRKNTNVAIRHLLRSSTRIGDIATKNIASADSVLQLTGRLASLTLVILAAGSAYATFPGRNGLIAFQAQTDTGIQIFTVRPNGQGLHQVTNVSGDAVAPDWSPDGRQIVFEHDAPGACANVAIINSDGDGLIDIAADPSVCEFDPSFTPDGSRIVFDRFDPVANDEAIWSMDRNGNDRQRIGPCCFDPNVSPNSEKLSFLSPNGQPGGTALFTSSIDGSNLFQVTPYSFDVAVKQDWAPDGQHLVFTQNGDVLMSGVSANVATVRPDGTDLRFVTHYQGGAVNAFVGSYSPDGRWIVFRINENGLFGLFKIHPDGTHLKTILPLSSFRPRFIDWGPRPSEEADDDDEDD